MKDLSELLNVEKENGSVFVFPSETAAVHWRKKFLDITGKKAVRNDRFLSWDKFKEEITLHNRTEKPVNSVIRKLFAVDLVRRNCGDSPIFRKLIPQQYRENSAAFADLVCRVLPELEKLVKSLEASAGTEDTELQQDYRRIYEEYLGFMQANGLFEPSWEQPELSFPDKRYFIIYPELVEDFPEYKLLLEDAGCCFFQKRQSFSGLFRQFDNSVIEVDTVLSEISDLFDAGVSNSMIAVTAADDETADILRQKAVLCGIPLNYRSGRPLADYPAGRLPELIRNCRTSMYSIDAMKGLLLFKAFNWKDPGAASALVRFGIEHRCLKNTSAAPSGDEWAKRLSRGRQYNLLDFYTNLKKRIEAIARCSTFADLSREIQVFVTSFLETDAALWDPESEQVFQRTREVLSALKTTEQTLEGVKADDPLSLWIQLLKEKIYVRQNAEAGVSVYPYRVSALINPEVHFVIGMSHDSTNIVSKPFSFLSDKLRKTMGVDDLVMTEDFIALYSESGRDVRFSGAAETRGGTALPPGLFIQKELVSRIQYRDEQGGLRKLPVVSEDLWWQALCRAGAGAVDTASAGGAASAAGAAPPIGKMQLGGLEYAAATFMRPKEFNAEKTAFPGSLERKLLERRTAEEDGRLKISATALNLWTECRFKFLISWILGIAEDEYILKPEDPLTAGNVLHEILFNFFKRLCDEKKSFTRADHPRYSRMIHDSVEEVFSKWTEGGNIFFGPAWSAFKRRGLAQLLELPGAESALYDGYKPEMLESWLTHDFPGIGVKAVGMVDRISSGPDGAVIIDYKKSWKKKTKGRFIAFDSEGGLQPPAQGYQLPFYVILAREAGLKVTGTSYYGIAEARHFPVSGIGGVLSEEEVELLCDSTLAAVGKMAESVRSGDYMPARRCGGCSYRAVCRMRFNVNWGER